MQMREEDQLSQNWQGKQLGNYRLLGQVGRGSFAQVYLGEHVHLQTQVAIKVLRARLSRQDQESFLAEAQMIARLQHPNIIQVLEFGIEESTPYLVMDYASGGTLRQRYHSGVTLTPLRILPHLKQIARALQFAHEQGIVHRDVKPENMLLDPGGELLLADFGIALGVQSSSSQSMEDIAGTVSYMAPELLQGKAVPVSDQYGLAVVLYEWLSGAPPFRGTFVEVASQHLFTPPPPLRQAAVSHEVEQVVLTALNKDPEQRFANMREFVTAFEQAALMGAAEKTVRLDPRQLALLHNVRQDTVPGPVAEEQEAKPSAPTGEDVATRPVPTSAASSSQSVVSTVETVPAAQLATLETSGSAVRSLSDAVSLPAKRPRGEWLIVLSAIVLVLLLCGEFAGYNYLLLRQVLAPLPPPTTAKQPGSWSVTWVPDKQAMALYNQITSKPPTYSSTMATSDAYNWFTERTDQGICSFVGRAYHITATSVEVPQYCGPEQGVFSDFAYQAQLTITRGDGGGLAFRLNSSGGNSAYYAFGFDREGVYGLLVAPQPFYLMLLHSSPAIATGLNRPNLLTVIARGKSIFLYINRHYVGSVTDATSSSGLLSIFAQNLNSRTTEVVCHGVQIWRL